MSAEQTPDLAPVIGEEMIAEHVKRLVLALGGLDTAVVASSLQSAGYLVFKRESVLPVIINALYEEVESQRRAYRDQDHRFGAMPFIVLADAAAAVVSALGEDAPPPREITLEHLRDMLQGIVKATGCTQGALEYALGKVDWSKS